MNLDCNLHTAEAKPATAIDVGGSAKQTCRHMFVDIVHLRIVKAILSKFQQVHSPGSRKSGSPTNHRYNYIRFRVINWRDCRLMYNNVLTQCMYIGHTTITNRIGLQTSTSNNYIKALCFSCNPIMSY